MARVVDEGEEEGSGDSPEGGRPEPPSVRARQRGQVNEIMDGPVEKLRENNPDKGYRYVYAPPQGSQYTQLHRRAAMGYKKVDLESEDIEIPVPGSDGAEQRVADVVLMEIPKELKEREIEHREQLAREDANRAERAFRQNIEEETEGHATPTGSIETESETYAVSGGA